MLTNKKGILSKDPDFYSAYEENQSISNIEKSIFIKVLLRLIIISLIFSLLFFIYSFLIKKDFDKFRFWKSDKIEVVKDKEVTKIKYSREKINEIVKQVLKQRDMEKNKNSNQPKERSIQELMTSIREELKNN